MGSSRPPLACRSSAPSGSSRYATSSSPSAHSHIAFVWFKDTVAGMSRPPLLVLLAHSIQHWKPQPTSQHRSRNHKQLADYLCTVVSLTQLSTLHSLLLCVKESVKHGLQTTNHKPQTTSDSGRIAALCRSRSTYAHRVHDATFHALHCREQQQQRASIRSQHQSQTSSSLTAGTRSSEPNENGRREGLTVKPNKVAA